MLRVINVKKDFPTVDYALYLIDQEIKYSKAIGNIAIVVIHGYGSKGKGGVIKDAIKKYLPIVELLSFGYEKRPIIEVNQLVGYFIIRSFYVFKL